MVNYPFISKIAKSQNPQDPGDPGDPGNPGIQSFPVGITRLAVPQRNPQIRLIRSIYLVT